MLNLIFFKACRMSDGKGGTDGVSKVRLEAVEVIAAQAALDPGITGCAVPVRRHIVPEFQAIPAGIGNHQFIAAAGQADGIIAVGIRLQTPVLEQGVPVEIFYPPGRFIGCVVGPEAEYERVLEIGGEFKVALRRIVERVLVCAPVRNADFHLEAGILAGIVVEERNRGQAYHFLLQEGQAALPLEGLGAAIAQPVDEGEGCQGVAAIVAYADNRTTADRIEAAVEFHCARRDNFFDGSI